MDMDRYKVQITKEALEDMEQIYNHIANVLSAPETAMKQYNRIADAIEKLETFPNRFCVVESKMGGLKGLRRKLIDNYSIFYLIEKDCVIVTNVIYSSSYEFSIT